MNNLENYTHHTELENTRNTTLNQSNGDSLDVSNKKVTGTPAIIVTTSLAVLTAIIVGGNLGKIGNKLFG